MGSSLVDDDMGLDPYESSHGSHLSADKMEEGSKQSSQTNCMDDAPRQLHEDPAAEHLSVQLVMEDNMSVAYDDHVSDQGENKSNEGNALPLHFYAFLYYRKGC